MSCFMRSQNIKKNVTILLTVLKSKTAISKCGMFVENMSDSPNRWIFKTLGQYKE